jgi:endonuclease YncB( thermonuclease family)
MYARLGWLLILDVLTAGLGCADNMFPVVRTIDGDTVVIDVGVLPEPLGTELHLRILGVDAPERHRPLCEKERMAAEEATVFVRDLIERETAVCDAIQVRLCAYTGVLVHNHPASWERDKFGGRVLGDLIFRDGATLSSMLLAHNHAKPYTGKGPKPQWC